jgi:hypothetical protein
VAAATLTAGCGTPGNTDDACTDVRNTMTRYTTDAPEFRAMTPRWRSGTRAPAIAGKLEAARGAYDKAFGNALRPIAGEAKTPELKAVITNVADAYSSGNGNTDALQEVVKRCPRQP